MPLGLLAKPTCILSLLIHSAVKVDSEIYAM
jgi:hypothetical protein